VKLSLLDLQLAFRRDSALAWTACVVAAAWAASYYFLVRPLEAENSQRARELQQAELTARMHAAPGPQPISLVEQRLSAFEETLCEAEKINALVGTLFDHAIKRNLVLAQAEYKLEHDKAGAFDTYQVSLPVRGPYSQLRAFVDSALADLRCASIEDIDFKREGIGATQIEARMKLVFFLKARAR